MSQTLTIEVPLEAIRLTPQKSQQSAIAVDQNVQTGELELSKSRAVVVIATLTGTTVVSSFSTGLLTVGLPRMAEDVNLPASLLLWPASVYS